MVLKVGMSVRPCCEQAFPVAIEGAVDQWIEDSEAGRPQGPASPLSPPCPPRCRTGLGFALLVLQHLGPGQALEREEGRTSPRLSWCVLTRGATGPERGHSSRQACPTPALPGLGSEAAAPAGEEPLCRGHGEGQGGKTNTPWRNGQL